MQGCPLQILGKFFSHANKDRPTDDIVQLMVTKTNRYAEHFLQAKHVKPNSRMHRRQATDANEMKTFLGIL